MQLLLVLLFLLRFTESSSVENDLLSSVDIIAFDYSQRVSRHWDCPQVGDHVAKAEEARIWQTVIPDARIEETVVASGNRAPRKAEQYEWINELSSDSLMQSSALLGMRRPDFDGNTAPVKVLYSKTRQVNQDALSAMLSQLEQSKDNILESMARTQVSITSMTPKTTDPFVDNPSQVPQATSYYLRIFNSPHLTTGDFVAWMALAAASRQKGHADAFKFFKLMVQSFLSAPSVSLGAVPTSSAGKPTKTVYLHRSFQDVPAGADLAFYFDGNRGRFLKTQNDSIVLNRPEGIVDGQQHAALVLSFDVNADASSLEMHQINADVAMQEVFHKELEKVLALDIPSGATETEATGLLTIRSHAARLERDSFLETQRKAPASKPKLLVELLPAELVKLVIDYFSDDAYPVIVSTRRWPLKGEPGIAVDSARLYVIIDPEGITGFNHSSAKLEEDDRRYLEFGDPRWSLYNSFTSSHDGQYASFVHFDKALLDRGKQTGFVTKWIAYGNDLEGGGFRPVAFEGEDSFYGLLSRDGQILCSHYDIRNVTRVYQIRKQSEKSPAAFMKFKLDGAVRAVSGKGNRIIMAHERYLKVRSVGKDASKRICRVNADVRFQECALNEDGSEAAFVTDDGVLRIMHVDKVAGCRIDQPAIATVNFPQSLERICRLVYSDENKLHMMHHGGRVSLFDPSTKKPIPIEVPREGQGIIKAAISLNADYIATLQCVGKEKEGGRPIYRTIVRRKLKSTDWSNIFGYEADKDKAAMP